MGHPVRKVNRCVRALAFGLIAGLNALPTPAQVKAVSDQRHPDVVDVKVLARGADRFDFDVTISSPYDSTRRYADAFRVMNADGRVYGERGLLHDHAGEQPFTRELHGVSIPPAVRQVVVQARDRAYGYGGKTVGISLPGR